MGAIGGPCSGHLSLSQVTLMEASAVGQLNSLPSISQTLAPSPEENPSLVMDELRGAEQIAENDHSTGVHYFVVVEEIHCKFPTNRIVQSTRNSNFSIFPIRDMVT